MPDRKSPPKTARQAAERAKATEKGDGFTAEERAAMRERAREISAARSGSDGANDEQTVLAKIASMSSNDRAMAERVHALITTAAPELSPRTWYGMPAYAKNGKVICFFQPAEKFKARYATLGFSDAAALDDGDMWPTAFAVKDMQPATEQRIIELVKRAVR